VVEIRAERMSEAMVMEKAGLLPEAQAAFKTKAPDAAS